MHCSLSWTGWSPRCMLRLSRDEFVARAYQQVAPGIAPARSIAYNNLECSEAHFPFKFLPHLPLRPHLLEHPANNRFIYFGPIGGQVSSSDSIDGSDLIWKLNPLGSAVVTNDSTLTSPTSTKLLRRRAAPFFLHSTR